MTMEIPAEIHNYALVVSYKTRKRCKHFHPNVSKPLWCFWWINRSVISFSWSLHLSRVTTKRFIKGWKIFLPSLRNIYQSIHSNSFPHCWAKPTSKSKLAATRNVFRASFQCFLGSSLNAVQLQLPFTSKSSFVSSLLSGHSLFSVLQQSYVNMMRQHTELFVIGYPLKIM